ncbi:MAG TPA: hypothetical protein VFD21_18070 [Vicinamibacterales bacterium]|nr:hypothetical protein [Vicinamibacterales bacterium]
MNRRPVDRHQKQRAPVAYIRKVWGQLFEIVEILPACIGNMQDLVVMRRR